MNGERVSNNKVCEGFTRGTGGGEEEKNSLRISLNPSPVRFFLSQEKNLSS